VYHEASKVHKAEPAVSAHANLTTIPVGAAEFLAADRPNAPLWQEAAAAIVKTAAKQVGTCPQFHYRALRLAFGNRFEKATLFVNKEALTLNVFVVFIGE